MKRTTGKPKISLLPRAAVEGAARAFEWGTMKYARDDWKGAEDPTVYLDAALRHIFAAVSGEDLDPESGLPHAHHATASMMIYADLTADRR